MSKRRELTLKQKVEVIEYVKSNRRVGARKVAEVFECGKSKFNKFFYAKKVLCSNMKATVQLIERGTAPPTTPR